MPFLLGGFPQNARDGIPHLIYTYAFHADIIFTLICELLTGTTGYGVADSFV